jgi:hypothetical protein
MTLAPGNTLHIGYGDSGVNPCYFELGPDQDADCTYFKVILTRCPADFSMVLQHDPCEKPPPLDVGKMKPSVATAPRRPEPPKVLNEEQYIIKRQERVMKSEMYFCIDVKLMQRSC